ncbi:MAG: hypothetical protein MJZ81_04315 [Bacteroidales bacterium]|nr:hypothetical protein [Bacteroidales bacterium]
MYIITQHKPDEEEYQQQYQQHYQYRQHYCHRPFTPLLVSFACQFRNLSPDQDRQQRYSEEEKEPPPHILYKTF